MEPLRMAGTTAGSSRTQAWCTRLALPGRRPCCTHLIRTCVAIWEPDPPLSTLIRDEDGNLYGTAWDAVYKVDTVGNFARLSVLPGNQYTYAGVVRDAAGNLFGTYSNQDGSYGGVYKVAPSHKRDLLYHFPGRAPEVPDPQPGPDSGVILDHDGNLYGATPYGGAGGMIYKLDGAGKHTVLYGFPPASGGTAAVGPLMQDRVGAIYGATYEGGTANAGVVYKLDPRGRETVLYTFTGGADGSGPTGPLVRDSAGNLYGTTIRGGLAFGSHGFGVAYKLDPAGHQTVLHSFSGQADGALPSSVVLDSSGNLYGTAAEGGAGSKTGIQEGVVFEIDSSGAFRVLYSFTGLSDGGQPQAGVIRDSGGNLYGTTWSGGEYDGGTVFMLAPTGDETVLHSFSGGTDGANPSGGVARDRAGNLYGTTANYGVLPGGKEGEGVAFRLGADEAFATLYTFPGGAAGGGPLVGVVCDTAGNLYGTAPSGGQPGCGGSGCGILFRVSPSGTETVLHSFTGGSDGGLPYFGVTLDPSGNLYRTTSAGGAGQGGVLYQVAVQ